MDHSSQVPQVVAASCHASAYRQAAPALSSLRPCGCAHQQTLAQAIRKCLHKNTHKLPLTSMAARSGRMSYSCGRSMEGKGSPSASATAFQAARCSSRVLATWGLAPQGGRCVCVCIKGCACAWRRTCLCTAADAMRHTQVQCRFTILPTHHIVKLEYEAKGLVRPHAVPANHMGAAAGCRFSTANPSLGAVRTSCTCDCGRVLRLHSGACPLLQHRLAPADCVPTLPATCTCCVLQTAAAPEPVWALHLELFVERVNIQVDPLARQPELDKPLQPACTAGGGLRQAVARGWLCTHFGQPLVGWETMGARRSGGLVGAVNRCPAQCIHRTPHTATRTSPYSLPARSELPSAFSSVCSRGRSCRSPPPPPPPPSPAAAAGLQVCGRVLRCRASLLELLPGRWLALRWVRARCGEHRAGPI